MRNSLFLGFEIIVYQIALMIMTASSCHLPPEYESPDNIVVISSLKDTVRHELHIVEFTKNVGYYSSSESISKVLASDEEISEAGEKYGVPKEMIQAVLFKELRMIDFRDGIADFLADRCFKINRNLSEKSDESVFCLMAAAITSTKGSSTGIGQIFPETAIKAHNWYCSEHDVSQDGCLDCKSTFEREKMWRLLQDEVTSIDYVALILKYEASSNLGIDISDASDEDIKRLFVRYNGAAYYGDEVFNYYTLFKEIKPA